MNPKVKRNNGAQSYSPRNNWKSSSKWIGSISVSWLWPSKGGHPKMRDSNRRNPRTLMVPVTERLWMFVLLKWKIICMLRRLDGIRPWSSLNPTWKAMPPHGGGQWNKRRGKTMVTLGTSLRNALSPNSFQGIPTTSRGANSGTLWMPRMTTCGNMWWFILNSCLRSGTCTSWIACANLWWGFQLGPSVSLKRIGPFHYPRPSWKWKAFRMWDGVKNPGSRTTTSSFTRSCATRGNGTEGKTTQERKSLNNSKARGSNPKEILWRKGLLSNRANKREMLVENPKEHASTVMKWGIIPKIAPNPNRGMGALR